MLTHTFVLLKQYTGIEVNWLITISNKVKANIQITASYLNLHANKNNSHYTNEISFKYTYLDGIRQNFIKSLIKWIHVHVKVF